MVMRVTVIHLTKSDTKIQNGQMLKVSIDRKVMILELDHPERGNCFGTKEAKALSKALKTKNISGIIMSASGSRFFCTGGDLKEQASFKTPAQGLKAQENVASALSALSQIDVPTVAIVSGDTFGGGTELLSVFDFIIASPHCIFGLWQRKMGLSFGWSGGERLAQRLSSKKISQLLLGAKTFSSFEAIEFGLVDLILPEQFHMQKAWQIIEGINQMPKEPFKKIKTRLNAKGDKKIFKSLWMNKSHQAVLKKYKK